MSDRKLKDLYKRIGAPLFARARRSLETDEEALAQVEAVMAELVKHTKLTDEELLKKGRELLQARVEAGSGGGIDSIDPVIGNPRKP